MRALNKTPPTAYSQTDLKKQDFYNAAALKTWSVSLLASLSISILPSVASAALEEVVVTARKTAESLQDTPISVTALSGERLEDMGLSRITKLQNVTPNLVFQNSPSYSGTGN